MSPNSGQSEVADDTRIQFPDEPEGQPEAPRVHRCATCGSRFSNDARFCPFDGELLVATEEKAPPPDPLLGKTIDDRYEVMSTLGEGGMGVVYRVRHRLLEKQLALKALRADLARDGDLGQRFIREARAAASVAHPNVVQITDFGSLPSGQPYFVMELLTGESLSTILRKGGPLPAERAVRVVKQIVAALAAAHAVGVVHRDLKPENIVVCQGSSGEIVKVLDFGLAKVAGQSRLTKAGVVFGTPYYMSPEQASGDAVDERADIYALGVVMYEVFTGRVPFEADTFMGVLTKHIYVAPTPPSVFLGGVAALGALEQIILRCLEKKPERRFESMSALGEELERVTKFTEDGALRVEPLELREPRPMHRLADELELPSAMEMRTRRLQTAPRLRPIEWAALALMVTVVAGLVATVVTLRARAKIREEARAAASAAAAEMGSASVRAEPRAPAVAPTPVPVSAPVPSAGSARALEPPSSVHAKDAHGGAARAVGGSPGSAAGGPKSSTTKGKVVGSDIVDPWSN